MTFQLLDTVVLNRELPQQGLRKGDLGAVVQVYSPDALEIEFVNAGGGTCAVVSLSGADVRPVNKTDVIAVRPVDIAAAG